MMYLIPIVVLLIVSLIYEYKKIKSIKRSLIGLLISIIISGAIIGIDYMAQTTDEEVWSGYIEAISHKEEWDEQVKHEITNDKGEVTGVYYTTEHHEAVNRVKTSDGGWISVKTSQDGKVRFGDSFPNTDTELSQYWKINTPTASVHTYTNKVQSSYSIFRHKEINLKKYKDLPEYPKDVVGYVNINRIIGSVPNKENALIELAKENTRLNKSIPDPEKSGKMRSWKQVNIIFINVGDKSEDYGFALQDKWENGNKNDFVVCFSMDSNNTIKWVYPFGWSEVENLKIEVRDYMMNLKQTNDFAPIVNQVSKMVEDKFIRKQFADFNYLQIEVRTGAIIVIWIFNIVIGWILKVFIDEEYKNRKRWR